MFVRSFGTRRRSMLILSGALAVSMAFSILQPTVSDAAPAAVENRSANMVTADSLPTTQIDGVAWSQVIIGNKVYVGGSFTTARPFGSAAGVNTVPRTNILAYNLSTGVLDSAFAPTLNGQVKTIARSPDGTRIYIGGDFTTVNGQPRNKIAAFNTADGSLVDTFKPSFNNVVRTIVVTSSTVYVGGDFTQVNGIWRIRLAALRATDGALTSWAPQADALVWDMELTPDGSKLIVGGQFLNINNSPTMAQAAIRATDGTLVPWQANTIVGIGGDASAITSVSTDGTFMYLTGFTFGGTHNFEGTLAAKPDTGEIVWLQDCHGDSYDSWSNGSTVYTVSHAHYCQNVGGFPQMATAQRAMAFSAQVKGTLAANQQSGYKDWAGTPSPAIQGWFPTLQAGTYTGQSQAAWNVTGNAEYLLLGGEFPNVNNGPQQGLARFAIPSKAPKKQGPRVNAASWLSSAEPVADGVRVSIPANWDRDDLSLTYTLLRVGEVNQVVDTATVESPYWSLPKLTLRDSGLQPGSSYRYAVSVRDRDGNTVTTEPISVVANGSLSGYADAVRADGASMFWRLGESAGPAVYDWIGNTDATAGSGVTRGAAGAVTGDDNRASLFSGTSVGQVSGPSTTNTAADRFSVEAWIKTTTASGGAIIDFGNRATGSSSSIDRVLYMDNAGRIVFGVHNGSVRTVSSTAAYRDGTWHHLVGTLGPSGQSLYVDGKRVGYRPDTSSSRSMAGTWRVGGDNLNGWTNKPSSNYLSGTIDEVAIYPVALTLQEAAHHATLGGKSVAVKSAPPDSYGARVFNDGAEVFWRVAESSGSTMLDGSLYDASAGTYSGGVTLMQSGALAGETNKAAKFDGVSGFGSSQNPVVNPSASSQEAWLKTTTTSGGELVGLGNSRTGNSTQYDRQLAMSTDGKIVYTVGAARLTSVGSYNNGSWHHVVGTNGPDGVRLYIDGALARSALTAAPLSLTGYWRVGGDTTGVSTSRFFNGTIDEVSVYYSAISAATVSAHYTLGSGSAPNAVPLAAFSTDVAGLTVSMNGNASSDTDGTVNSFAWNWGDGTAAGSGATPTHTYATAGTYQVTLTVADNLGGVGTHTAPVTVAPNISPVASFAVQVDQLTADVDASASSDPDGSVETYTWEWGDGSAVDAGKTNSHTYDEAGTYEVMLSVIDNAGAVDTETRTVTVSANLPPKAVFAVATTGLVVDVDAHESTDADGTIRSYTWNWGDGGLPSTGVSASHAYAEPGNYKVELTVTDDRAATSVSSTDITVSAPNIRPVAAFDWTVSDTLLTVDASTSDDPDGEIVNYAWSWGDGSVDGAGSAATHTYASAGTFTVVLTVTDDRGATTEVEHRVITTVAPTVLAADAFERTVGGGWGLADTGGSWSVVGSTTRFSVAGGIGRMNLATAGASLSASLPGVSGTELDAVVDVAFDKPLAGAAAYAAVDIRRNGSSMYRIKARVDPNGAVQLSTVRVVSGAETALQTVTVPGLSYRAGDTLRMSAKVVTAAGGSVLSGKIWKVGDSEPVNGTVSSNDGTAVLQAAGAVGLWAYLGSTATNTPLLAQFDNFRVKSSQ